MQSMTRVRLVKLNSLGRLSRLRHFSSSAFKLEIRDVESLPQRLIPRYQESHEGDLLSLQWPAPPRNILITKKKRVQSITEALIEFANHVTSTYPSTAIILERHVAEELHSNFAFPIYSPSSDKGPYAFHQKVDLMVTLGGDGTILRASSLFSTCYSVPPMLSFSMGTLGFLSEWKFPEYKRAFREVYMSGADAGDRVAILNGTEPPTAAARTEPGLHPTGWSTVRGKSMRTSRGAQILMRNRLKVGLFTADGQPVQAAGKTWLPPGGSGDQGVYVLNEVLIHRGQEPHLVVVDIFLGGRFLTEAVADGVIVSTPTGSTAYNLSCGGSIVHPLVPSVLLTPICARSLSFRPLVLPATTPVTLKLSEKNRGRALQVSIDGVNIGQGMAIGMEARVWNAEMRRGKDDWHGGVPSVMRQVVGGEAHDEWVGGLNGLLKFNYPLGDGR